MAQTIVTSVNRIAFKTFADGHATNCGMFLTQLH